MNTDETRKPLSIGATGESSVIVTSDMTASHWGSGLVPAFATPSLVALMENAAVEALQPFMDTGQTTVGVEIAIRHLAATPVGMKVTARAEVAQIDGRRVQFKLSAWDEQEPVGEGTHWRVLVDAVRFQERFEQKALSVRDRASGPST